MFLSPQELRNAYVLCLAELDRLFAQECYRQTIGFFPTVRVWVCPNCDSTIPDTGLLPSPMDMTHQADCAWIEQLQDWPQELVNFYIGAWMQRNPMSKRIIRNGFLGNTPSDPGFD